MMGALSILQPERRWLLLASALWCAAFLYPLDKLCLGANLTLFSSATSDNPLNVQPQVESAPITVGVLNNVSMDLPSEFLTGWQLILTIEPENGAIGTVAFASATQADGYVFDGTSSFGIDTANSGNEVSAGDFNFPYSGGVQVPNDAGATLLSLTFNASANASGTFGVFAVGGIGNSQWTDAAEPIQNVRAFDNVPSSGIPARIGEIFVGLPGDFDQDGDVDGNDFLAWQRGGSPVPLSQSDLAEWQQYYGTIAPHFAASLSIPEPMSLTLLGLGALVMNFRRRRPDTSEKKENRS